jgi:hypothetical protein
MHHPSPTPASTPRYTGEVVYLFAYDIAHEMGRAPVHTLFNLPVSLYRIDSSRRNPRHQLFFRPLTVRLPDQDRIGPHGPVRVIRDLKILPIGALSVRVRIPFAVDSLEDLVAYHDLQFSNGALNDEIRALADEARRELAPFIVRPVDRMSEEEAYTVFCIRGPLPTHNPGSPRESLRAESWLETHRRSIASVLTQEPSPECLSRQETLESTSRHLSYYEDDLIVIDWNAALLVDEPDEWEETLYVLELANVQLAELEAYDRILDSSLERTYRDLSVSGRGRSQLRRELRELRIDLARFSDELSNITKFFGDWHLARVYQMASARFHLDAWHGAVNNKLRTVGELHEMLKTDLSNRWMMILEATIVLLFIIDLIILLAGSRH